MMSFRKIVSSSTIFVPKEVSLKGGLRVTILNFCDEKLLRTGDPEDFGNLTTVVLFRVPIPRTVKKK